MLKKMKRFFTEVLTEYLKNPLHTFSAVLRRHNEKLALQTSTLPNLLNCLKYV